MDFDHSLNVAINKLRQALKDPAEEPQFIETLPRRGYRFIARPSSKGCAAVRSDFVEAGQKLQQGRRAFLAGPATNCISIGTTIARTLRFAGSAFEIIESKESRI